MQTQCNALVHEPGTILGSYRSTETYLSLPENGAGRDKQMVL
uniref:Uncharacterized protein n=1 Tax=Anguilla anguilla TaxID=7936 RepID=A0A0E9XE04_ANGAN